MRILLIEDEDAIARVITRGLAKERFQVEVASDGAAGLEMLEENRYALVILDLMLPGKNGFEVCRTLRARRDSTPILMLTARDSTADKVRGLETGADDYLTKPFAFEELVARVRAQVRRGSAYRGAVLTFRDVALDTVARTVTRAGVDVALTPREYSLLEALARNEGRPLTREAILEVVWADGGRTGSNVVDVYVNLLRRKLDSDTVPEERLIHTIKGVGYVLRRPTELGLRSLSEGSGLRAQDSVPEG